MILPLSPRAAGSRFEPVPPFLEMDMSTLTPHGACLDWQPALIWLNTVSDAMVATAFFTTALVLGLYVARRRGNVMFPAVFWALTIFTAACGMTRLVEILTLWVPAYGLEATTKSFLAL